MEEDMLKKSYFNWKDIALFVMSIISIICLGLYLKLGFMYSDEPGCGFVYGLCVPFLSTVLNPFISNQLAGWGFLFAIIFCLLSLFGCVCLPIITFRILKILGVEAFKLGKKADPRQVHEPSWHNAFGGKRAA